MRRYLRTDYLLLSLLLLSLLVVAGCPGQPVNQEDGETAQTSDTQQTEELEQSVAEEAERLTGGGEDGDEPSPGPFIPAVERLTDQNYYKLGSVEGRRTVIITNLGATDGYWGYPDLARWLQMEQLEPAAVVTTPGGLDPDNFPNVRAEEALSLVEELDLPVAELDREDPVPPEEHLADADIVILDLPWVASRAHLHASVTANLFETMAGSDALVATIDHPSPGNFRVDGPVVEPGETSARAPLPIPLFAGVTLSGVVTMTEIDLEHEVSWESSLAANYGVDTPYHGFGFHFTSPDGRLHSIEAVRNYPGLVLFEGTNVSLGEGLDERYFTVVGAPWLDPEAVIGNVDRRIGFGLEETSFTPEAGPYAGRELPGIRFNHPTDPSVFEPLPAALSLLAAIQETHPEELELRPELDEIFGREWLREMVREGAGYQQIRERFSDESLSEWEEGAQRGMFIGYSGDGTYNGAPPDYYTDWRPPYAERLDPLAEPQR